MDLLAVAGRVVLSLAVVLVLLWIAARTLRRGQQRGSRGVAVEVLARQSLAQRSSVAVVQVGDRALVLGVTESRVELLTEQPVDTLLKATEPEPAAVEGIEHALPVRTAEAPVTASRTPAGKPAGSPAGPAAGPLAGSALSPATWSKALDAVRELTVRK